MLLSLHSSMLVSASLQKLVLLPVLAQETVLSECIANLIVVKLASNSYSIVLEYFALESFWPFVSLQKLVILRFFKVSLSGVCAKAELGVD